MSWQEMDEDEDEDETGCYLDVHPHYRATFAQAFFETLTHHLEVCLTLLPAIRLVHRPTFKGNGSMSSPVHRSSSSCWPCTPYATLQTSTLAAHAACMRSCTCGRSRSCSQGGRALPAADWSSDEDDDDEFDSASEEELSIPAPEETTVFRQVTRKNANKMSACLSEPRVANALVVQLIDQENRMQELRDMHENPNIDCAAVLPSGKLFSLPQGCEWR